MLRPRRSRPLLRGLRDAVTAYARTYEEGITASVFALALLVLMGMVALGIDGGRIFDERRRAQNAADHAAIAAALSSCTGATLADAINAGEDSADENGYDGGANNDVLIQGDIANHVYSARIDTTISTSFAQVIGFGQLTTNGFAEAQATGCDTSGASHAAIHAGGNNCLPGSLRNVEISGNLHTVNGLTYTNGSFDNGGENSRFLNPPDPSVEWVSSFDGGNANNTYDGPDDQVSLPPTEDRWPNGYDPTLDMTNTMWDALRDSPNRAPANIAGGNFQSSFAITSNGIWYTEYNSTVDITGISPGVTHFTIASKFGAVKIGNDYTLRDFSAFATLPSGVPSDTIVLSGYDGSGTPCDQFAFERSGNGGTWNGTFWTPRAMSRWSGNSGTINGGFVSWAFQMNGNSHTINGGTGTPAADPDVTLTE